MPAGVFEEVGWTGLAVPALRRRRGLLAAQMLFYVAVLPAYRVLMVWVHDRTDSLLVAMLMHASLTGSVLFLFMPAGISESSLMVWYAAMAGVLWVAVAALTVAGRRGLQRG